MNKIIFTTESSAILDFLIDFMRKTLTVKELQIFFGKDFDVYESKKTFLQKTLKLVNDEGNIEELIKKLFNPIEYINKEAELDAIITDFNKYLKFAQFKIVRTETEIFIHPLHQINTKNKRL
jgi:hypothetical protein